MEIEATYFGANGWLIGFKNTQVLIDPWLKGELSFFSSPWLIKGTLNKELRMPTRINLLLLTQGLPDHSHRETLEAIPRDTPVIGSIGAIEVVKKLGFKSLFPLVPGKGVSIDGIYVQATAGAKVPQIENGYLIKHKEGSIYIEPHGFLDPSIEDQKIDIVITPVINIEIPLLGSFINGNKILKELVKKFKPKYILASTTGGDISFKGILKNTLRAKGSFVESTIDISKDISCIDPIPGKRYQLNDPN